MNTHSEETQNLLQRKEFESDKEEKHSKSLDSISIQNIIFGKFPHPGTALKIYGYLTFRDVTNISMISQEFHLFNEKSFTLTKKQSQEAKNILNVLMQKTALHKSKLPENSENVLAAINSLTNDNIRRQLKINNEIFTNPFDKTHIQLIQQQTILLRNTYKWDLDCTRTSICDSLAPAFCGTMVGGVIGAIMLVPISCCMGANTPFIIPPIVGGSIGLACIFPDILNEARISYWALNRIYRETETYLHQFNLFANASKQAHSVLQKIDKKERNNYTRKLEQIDQTTVSQPLIVSFKPNNELVNDMSCPVTKEIFLSAVRLNCNGKHAVEEDTANMIIATTKKCPCCRERVTTSQPDRLINNLVDGYLKQFPQLRANQYQPNDKSLVEEEKSLSMQP